MIPTVTPVTNCSSVSLKTFASASLTKLQHCEAAVPSSHLGTALVSCHTGHSRPPRPAVSPPLIWFLFLSSTWVFWEWRKEQCCSETQCVLFICVVVRMWSWKWIQHSLKWTASWELSFSQTLARTPTPEVSSTPSHPSPSSSSLSLWGDRVQPSILQHSLWLATIHIQ